jgi:hypothetical protein
MSVLPSSTTVTSASGKVELAMVTTAVSRSRKLIGSTTSNRNRCGHRRVGFGIVDPNKDIRSGATRC